MLLRTSLVSALFIMMAFAGCARFGGPGPVRGESLLEPDGMIRIDGQRSFIIGLYENPKDDAKLKEAVQAGFNLVRCAQDKDALDRVAAAGARAWANTGSRIDLSQDQEGRIEALSEMAAKTGHHPALLVWEVPDEALWNCWYRPYSYRLGKEREKLEARIEALEDSSLAADLTEELERAQALFKDGYYGEAERLADDLCLKLGEQPNDDMKLTTAPERAAAMAEGMLHGYQLLTEIDPVHPIWMNHAPRNPIPQLAAFNRAADIVGCDIYPVPSRETGHPDIANRSLASVGAYTRIMAAAAPGKPVWMVLQGCGWADIGAGKEVNGEETRLRPDFEESRFMAYDAIVNGARGILYWGTSYVEKDSEFWYDLMKVAKELDELQPILSAPDAKLDLDVSYAETMSSLDLGVKILAKETDDKPWLLVANEQAWPLTFTIHGLKSLEGTVYTDAATGRGGAVTKGTLTLTIPGQRVHVLAPSETGE